MYVDSDESSLYTTRNRKCDSRIVSNIDMMTNAIDINISTCNKDRGKKSQVKEVSIKLSKQEEKHCWSLIVVVFMVLHSTAPNHRNNFTR